MHRSTSGTSRAMSMTPSPCARWWSSRGLSGCDPALDHEPARAAREHERLVVTVAGLRAGVGDQLHAEGRLVVVRGLGRVADHEDHRVPPGHRERVRRRVVLHQPDELLELLEVEARPAFSASVRGAMAGSWAGLRQSVMPRNRSASRRQLRNHCDILVHILYSSRAALLPDGMRSMPIPDDLDAGGSCALFTADPRIGVLECSRRLGVARGTVQARLDRMARDGVVRGWGPDARPGGDGLRRHRLRHAGDPPAPATGPATTRCRPPRRDPGGPGGAHDHRRG